MGLRLRGLAAVLAAFTFLAPFEALLTLAVFALAETFAADFAGFRLAVNAALDLVVTFALPTDVDFLAARDLVKAPVRDFASFCILAILFP